MALPLLVRDAAHFGSRPDRHARRLGGARQRLGDGAHAAADDSVVLGVLAEGAVPVECGDVGAARRANVSHVHRACAYGRLDLVRDEVAVDQVPERDGQQRLEELLLALLAEPFTELGERGRGC